MRLFARLYDKIYSQKDYAGEVDFVITQLCEADRKSRHLLEIGAGTGAHTTHLRRHFDTVYAVEIDSEMSALGKNKTSSVAGIHWHEGPLETFNTDVKFNGACALFNVMNYIRDTHTARRFLQDIHSKLAPHGRFVFDCWNGVATLRQSPLPESRFYEFQDGTKLIQKISTHVDAIKQQAVIDYKLQTIENNEITDTGNEKIEIRIWTPQELYDLAEQTGFTVLTVRDFRNPQNEADMHNHRLWFVWQRDA